MKAVFDTNIVIDALNGSDEADQEYSRYERVFISPIMWMEVMVGASKQDEASVRDFLPTQFEILPVDEQVAEEAVGLRRSHRIRLPDAIIGATACVNQVTLVSRNIKDFHADWDGICIPYILKPGP